MAGLTHALGAMVVDKDSYTAKCIIDMVSQEARIIGMGSTASAVRTALWLWCRSESVVKLARAARGLTHA